MQQRYVTVPRTALRIVVFSRSWVAFRGALRSECANPHCPIRFDRRVTFPIPNALTSGFLVAVVSAKKKTYFELFCVPVFPMSSKHVWVCGICQWRVPLQQGYVPIAFLNITWCLTFVLPRWEPPFPGQGYHHPPQGQWQQGPPPGQISPQGPGYPPPLPPGHPNK